METSAVIFDGYLSVRGVSSKAVQYLSALLIAILAAQLCKQSEPDTVTMSSAADWPVYQIRMNAERPKFEPELVGAMVVQDEAQKAKAVVSTSFYPTTYLVERIGGDGFDVRCLLPSTEDPVHWKPKVDVLRQFRSADLIILQGGGLDAWARYASLPRTRVLETTRDFKERLLEYSQEQTHSHGREGEHSHRGTDPHFWMDPQFIQLQANAIAKALTRLSPEHATQIEVRSAKLKADIEKWKASLELIGPLLGNEPLVAAHPAYEYLAKGFGWKISNIELSPTQKPTSEQLVRLRQLVSEHGARFILWESAPDAAVHKAIELSTGLIGLVYSPCEHRPVAPSHDSEEGRSLDFLGVMKRNAETLLNALKPERQGQ